MGKFKVKVTNKSEVLEIEKTLSTIGMVSSNYSGFSYPKYIANNIDGEFSDYTMTDSGIDNFKLITIQELRDMVNSMKEYLEKQADGSYKLVMRGIVGKDDDIEVPEWANYGYKNDKGVYFSMDGLGSPHQLLLWQRHTQPEELPFMDDEPTLDKVKIKINGDLNQAVKIAKDMGYYNCQFDKIPQNAYWLLCNESGSVDYSMNENILNEYAMLHIQDEPKSLNDQYAEIEQVRKQTVEATLAERQAQYGCFEDVAFVTENIMAVLSKVRTNGLNDLPHTHRMALYMIASKMARIVNGDFNYRDNWHDIGGYSKLVEDLL